MPAEHDGGPLVGVHGGVDMELRGETFAALEQAAKCGATASACGSDALGAATEALSVPEDDPAFNAGYGSVLTREGTVETEGAVVDGRSGRFAGVAAVPDAGYWADGQVGVLCSGSGEAVMKTALAFRVAERAPASGVPESAHWAVTTAADSGATVAVLVVDAGTRQVAATHNGASFPVVGHDGTRVRVHPALELEAATR